MAGVADGVVEREEFADGPLVSGATGVGAGLEDAVFLDLESIGDADESNHGGMVVFRHPGLVHYQRLIESTRSCLADLELEYGVENSKVV